MPQILTFQITLSFMVNFHLTLRKQRKEKNLKFEKIRNFKREKKSEISEQAKLLTDF